MLRNKFLLETETKIDLIDIDQILYLTTENYSLEIHFQDGSYFNCARSLSLFEEALGSKFFKINRSTLVNIRCINYIDKRTGNLFLFNGKQLHVSHRNLSKLIKQLKENSLH